jgi:hypothetical protein
MLLKYCHYTHTLFELGYILLIDNKFELVTLDEIGLCVVSAGVSSLSLDILKQPQHRLISLQCVLYNNFANTNVKPTAVLIIKYKIGVSIYKWMR